MYLYYSFIKPKESANNLSIVYIDLKTTYQLIQCYIHLKNKSSFKYFEQMSNKLFMKDFYIVQKILDRRTSSNGSYEYFVKWKNYSHKVNTWQPLTHLSTVISLVEKFNEDYEKKMGINKSRSLNESSQCVKKQDKIKSVKDHVNSNLKKREKLTQSKLDRFFVAKPKPINNQITKQKIKFLTSFSEQYLNKQPPKHHNKTFNIKSSQQNNISQVQLKNKHHSNYLHPNNLFNSSQCSYSQQSQSIISDHQQLDLLIQDKIDEEMFESGPIDNNPCYNQLPCENYSDSHQIVPQVQNNEQKKLQIKQEQSSPNQSYYYVEENQIKVHHISSVEVAQKNQKYYEQSTVKPSNLFSNEGSVVSGNEKYKNRDTDQIHKQKQREDDQQENRQRSRNKRIFKVLDMQENQKYKVNSRSRRNKISKLIVDRELIEQPRIKIDEIPPPASLTDQLSDFNHKRLCQIEHKLDLITEQYKSGLIFKVQNEQREVVKIELQEIKSNFPGWLKQYFQSFI